jgi:hypothetical protein
VSRLGLSIAILGKTAIITAPSSGT